MMITAAQSKQIWERVQANHARLEKCPGHRFQAIPNDGKTPRKYGCTVCGGEIDAVSHYWYAQGLKHATANSAQPLTPA